MIIPILNTILGQEYFDEALSYIEKHKLYAEALAIWADNEDSHKVKVIYKGIKTIFTHLSRY